MFVIFFGREACGIFTPQPGTEATHTPALEGEVLTTGSPGKSLETSDPFYEYIQGFPGGSVVKNPSASAGDVGSIPGLGRSPGEGNGNPR